MIILINLWKDNLWREILPGVNQLLLPNEALKDIFSFGVSGLCPDLGCKLTSLGDRLHYLVGR
jgi:hypothetical protein